MGKMNYDWDLVMVTEHAYDRAKERLGYTKKATSRMSKKAFAEGLLLEEMSGNLYNYLEEKQTYRWNKECDYRIYGEAIYVFTIGQDDNFGDTYPLLVTVLIVPKELRSQAKSQMKKKKTA